MLEGNDEQACL